MSYQKLKSLISLSRKLVEKISKKKFDEVPFNPMFLMWKYSIDYNIYIYIYIHVEDRKAKTNN
jgi:hypothetical protein